MRPEPMWKHVQSIPVHAVENGSFRIVGSQHPVVQRGLSPASKPHHHTAVNQKTVERGVDITEIR